MLKLMTGPLLTQGRESLMEICAELMKSGEMFAYLVPTPEMQSRTKAALIQKMLPESGKLAIFSPQVYLFDGFVNEMLKDALVYTPPLGVEQQRFILEEVTLDLHERGELLYLQAMVGYAGFYQSLHDWLREVKALGITPGDWLREQATGAKERELGLIYRDYEEFLTNHELADRERNYATLIGALTTADQSLPGRIQQISRIYIDGFYKLDPLQLRLLKACLKAKKDVTVHTFVEDGRRELFQSAQEMLTELRQMAQEVGAALEEEVHNDVDGQARSQVLNQLCRNLFDLNAPGVAGSEELQIFHTPDPHAEVALIGREIKQALLREEGLKLDEIAVIVRNLAPYHFYIQEVFADLGVPYELAAGLKLTQTALFRLILKLYRIVAENWSRQSVIEVLKSPYLQLGEPAVLEEYEQLILEAGVIGGREQWLPKLGYYSTHLKKELERELVKRKQENRTGATGAEQIRREPAKVRELRRKIALLQGLEVLLQDTFHRLDGLARSQSLDAHSRGLWDFLAYYQIHMQIGNTRDHDILRRDLLSLGRFEEMLHELSQFADFLPKRRKLTALEFLQELQQAADGEVIPNPGVPYDAVQILTPSRSRGHQFKLVFIGGLVEGDFPWYGSRDWLLTPEERRGLKERGIRFTQVYERLEEERLFFLDAASTATKKLVLTSPVLMTSESGRSSSFLSEVLNLYHPETICHEDKVQVAGGERPGDLTEVLTRRELDECLLQVMWEGNVVPEGSTFLAELAAAEGELAAEQSMTGAHLDTTPVGGTATPKELTLQSIQKHRLSGHFAHLHELYSRGAMVQLREGVTYSRYDGILQSAEIAERLWRTYHPERVYSISQINDFAVCPFQFFCKRVLHLDEVEEPVLRLEPLDLGSLYHTVLFAFFRDFPGWEGETLAAGLGRMEEIVREKVANFGPGLSLPRGLWTIYQEEILETLKRLLTFEYNEAAKQGYEMRPAYLEVSFGLPDELQEEGAQDFAEPVVIRRMIESGREEVVRFSGKIDRIDMSRDGEYLIIYDYKLGRRAKGFEELEEGIDVQLPVYIHAAQAIGGGGKEVLGAGYFALNQCKRDSGIWRDSREDLVPVTKRSKKCLGAEEWQEKLAEVDRYIVDYVEQIRAGDFRLNPAKCPPYCKFTHICRFEHGRNRRKEMALRIAGGEA